MADYYELSDIPLCRAKEEQIVGLLDMASQVMAAKREKKELPYFQELVDYAKRIDIAGRFCELDSYKSYINYLVSNSLLFGIAHNKMPIQGRTIGKPVLVMGYESCDGWDSLDTIDELLAAELPELMEPRTATTYCSLVRVCGEWEVEWFIVHYNGKYVQIFEVETKQIANVPCDIPIEQLPAGYEYVRTN